MRFAETYQNAPRIRATYMNVIKIAHISTGCIHGYIVKDYWLSFVCVFESC